MQSSVPTPPITNLLLGDNIPQGCLHTSSDRELTPHNKQPCLGWAVFIQQSLLHKMNFNPRPPLNPATLNECLPFPKQSSFGYLKIASMTSLSFLFQNKPAPLHSPATLQGFSFSHESVQPGMNMTLQVYSEGSLHRAPPWRGLWIGRQMGEGIIESPGDSPNLESQERQNGTVSQSAQVAITTNTPQSGGLKQLTFSSHSSGSWRSGIKEPTDSVPGKNSLPDLQMATFSPVLMGHQALGSLPLHIGSLMPLWKPHPPDLI